MKKAITFTFVFLMIFLLAAGAAAGIPHLLAAGFYSVSGEENLCVPTLYYRFL